MGVKLVGMSEYCKMQGLVVELVRKGVQVEASGGGASVFAPELN